MGKYCITAANHNSKKDSRASEFKVWEWRPDAKDNVYKWCFFGKKSLHDVAKLLATGNEVISGKEVQRSDGIRIQPGAPIEIELRIAKNDEDFKITDLPEF